jgi:hypothetical protein
MAARVRVRWLARLFASFVTSACHDVRSALAVVVPLLLTASKARHAGLLVAAALITLSAAYPVCAQDNAGFYEVETKYIFGFTEGSGIGLEGEKEFSWETVARFGKRDGRYWASETKLEYEFTPNQYVQLEFGPLLSTHDIRNVTDMDNRNQVAFGGLFGEIRYLLLDRGPSSPLAVTLSSEGVWRRSDETSGERVTNFELELKLNADLELIKNRLYLGANLLYEPEATHDPDHIGGGLGEGIERWRFCCPVLPHNPCRVCGCGALVSPPLRRDLVQYLHRRRCLSRAHALRPVEPQGVRDCGLEYASHGPRCRRCGLHANLAEFSRHRAKLKLAVEF